MAGKAAQAVKPLKMGDGEQMSRSEVAQPNSKTSEPGGVIPRTLSPAASVSGLLFAHPASRYFSVDRITKDQVESYATRSGQTVAEVERWLMPNLGY